jgi:hypothetical protein
VGGGCGQVGFGPPMHNIGMRRWDSGLPDQPFRYTGTDVVEERDGRVAVFYTFIDGGTPVCLKILRFPRN